MIRTEEYTELLRQMIRIPSPSFGEDGVCSLLSSALDGFGLPHRRFGNNLMVPCRNFSPKKKTLALLAHMDTVPAAGGYTRDPYDPGVDDSIIYGLGANDDGGSVVSMIAAFRHFFEAPLPFNLLLVLGSEEERSGENGAAAVFAPEGPLVTGGLNLPDWAIVGEPTCMKAATSERGLLVLDGLARGKSGHAARGEGVNALYIALDDIAALRAHSFDRISPAMGEVMLNVTQIQAGSAHNVIPDECRFVVDIRPTEKYTNSEMLAELQKICRSELNPRNLRNRSSATRQDSPLLKAAADAGMPAFSSPTTSDWMRLDCDALKLGPGDSARSHRADEYILTEEIRAGIDGYIAFINAFYGNFVE